MKSAARCSTPTWRSTVRSFTGKVRGVHWVAPRSDTQPAQQVVKIVNEELTDVLGQGVDRPLNFANRRRSSCSPAFGVAGKPRWPASSATGSRIRPHAAAGGGRLRPIERVR